MDYSTEKYALIKSQWDLIHNPQTTTGLLDGMEEGAMVCLGIFDDCKDVMAILRQIKAAAANRQKVTIRKDAYPKGKVFNAYYLDVDGETYDQLRVVYTPVPKDVAVDPLTYTRADRDVLAADGTVYRQRGIDFADGGRTVFTIEIRANEDVYEQKYEKLRRYLFEQGVNGKNSRDTIRIYITRVHTGSNSTVGLLRTDDGAITGYTVELPRGSDSQCKTICTDKIKPYDCYCIDEGIYNFEINKRAYKKGNPKNHSLRLTSAVPDGRLGVLVHGGRDDAKGWSQGCILPMPNYPEINSELYSSNRNNTVEQSIYFTKEILDWVKLREAEIKKENKDIEKVVKQIIITKTF